MSKVMTIHLQKVNQKRGIKKKKDFIKGKKKGKDGGKWIAGTGKSEGEAKQNKAE